MQYARETKRLLVIRKPGSHINFVKKQSTVWCVNVSIWQINGRTLRRSATTASRYESSVLTIRTLFFFRFKRYFVKCYFTPLSSCVDSLYATPRQVKQKRERIIVLLIIIFYWKLGFAWGQRKSLFYDHYFVFVFVF